MVPTAKKFSLCQQKQVVQNHLLVIHFKQNLLKQETRKLVILKASQYIQKLKELITWSN